MSRTFKLLLASAAVASLSTVPSLTANAWTELRVAQDAPTLNVDRGRSTVVEVEAPFSTIAVADPGIATVTATSNRSFFVRGLAPGWTTILIYDEEGSVVEIIGVNVELGLDALRSDLNALLPDEEIQVVAVYDGIYMKGAVSTASAAAKAIELAERHVPGGVANGLTIMQSQQVLLEVRFVEISREAVKSFSVGTNFFEAGEFSVATDASSLFGAAQTAALVSGIPLGGGASLDLTIEALEEQGIARTLANPNVISLSGESASFLAGGEFPIPVAQDEGQVTVEFRDFGVGLAFTPTVLAEDIINLKVTPEVSALDFASAVTLGGVSVPGLSVRRAETTVELRDGQAFAIAGLLQNEYANDVRKTPWLADVPILGSLFTSRGYRRAETELMIIITPRLVQPAPSIEAITTPLDYTEEPSEAEFFILDKTISIHELSTY